MEKDTVWKSYLSDNERFADLINGILFCGRQIVKADSIEELDTQTGYVKHPGEKRKKKIKIRDTARRVWFESNYAHVAIECEEYVDYCMPLRDMNYNVGDYEKQAAKVRRQVNQEQENLHGGERMYRFKKKSCVRPSVSLTLYFGKEEWDGPKEMHDMTSFVGMPEEIRTWTQNYRMHILEVRKMKDTSVFQTDVRQVLDFIRYSDNKKALKELVTKDEYYQNMEEDAWEVVVQYAKVEKLINVKKYYGEDGKINMCQALIEWMEDERREGFAQGEKAGEIRGEKRGEKIGEKRGRRIGEKRAEERHIQNLMKSMNITAEQAAAYLEIRTDRIADVSAKKAVRFQNRRKRRHKN